MTSYTHNQTTIILWLDLSTSTWSSDDSHTTMGKAQMSNSERQARSRNLQEQQQLRKQLEDLSLKEISNKNTGRVETQKWRQFLKDCVKNTGSCSLIVGHILKGNHDNTQTSERDCNDSSRQRSKSESQLYINYQKPLINYFKNESKNTTCCELADAGKVNTNSDQHRRSLGLSKSYKGMTREEIITSHRWNKKTDPERLTTSWEQSASLLESRRSLRPRASVTPTSDTELAEYAALDLNNSEMKPKLPTSSLASYTEQAPGSTRLMCMRELQHDQLGDGIRAGCAPEQVRSAEMRTSLPNITNNMQNIQTHNVCYRYENDGEELQENGKHPHIDTIHEDVQRTRSWIPHVNLFCTGETKHSDECSKSSLVTPTCNSQEGRTPDTNRHEINTKEEIIGFNQSNQSSLGVTALCTLNSCYSDTDKDVSSGTRGNIKQGRHRTNEQTASHHTPHIIDMKKQYSTIDSAISQHKTKIQFPKELNTNSETHLRSMNTDIMSHGEDRRYRNVDTLLQISDSVKTPPRARNEANTVVIDLLQDQATGNKQRKSKIGKDTEIDLDQFQVTVPEENRLDGYDSNDLITKKVPLLCQDPHRPDRISTDQLSQPGNRLTNDQNNQYSNDGRNIQSSPHQRKAHSSIDYQTRKHSSDSVIPNLRELSIKLGTRYQGIKCNNKMSFLRNDTFGQKDKNLLVKSSCRRPIINTTLPGNMQEKHAAYITDYRPGHTSVGFSTSVTRVFTLQDADFKDSAKCPNARPTKQETERLGIDRGNKHKRVSKIPSVQTCPTPAESGRESPAGCINDDFSNTPSNAEDGLGNVTHCQHSGEMLSREEQRQTVTNRLSEYHQSAQSGSFVSEINHSRESSCVLLQEISKQSSNIQRSRESANLGLDKKHYKEPAKGVSNMKQSRGPANSVSDNKHSRELANSVSVNKHCKEPSNSELNDRYSEGSTNVISDIKLSRKPLRASSNMELSRRQDNINMRKSHEQSSPGHTTTVSANGLSDLKYSEKSVNKFCSMNQFLERNVNNLKESNSGLSHNIKHVESENKQCTENGVFNREESNTSVNETNHIKDNYVDNTDDVSRHHEVEVSTVYDPNPNTMAGLDKQSVSLACSVNDALFEDLASMSTVSDRKLATTSRDASTRVASTDPSSLSRVKDYTISSCRGTKMQYGTRGTAQRLTYLHTYWQTFGGRVMAGNLPRRSTITADVMMSKRARQRAICQMMEDNLKRPINDQKLLADEALRMRVKEFLRSF